MSIGDDAYPPALRHVFDPPARLWVRGVLAGRMRELARPAIAIVGARDASAYGLGVARVLSADLARRGVTIVSGLARGIDGAAHLGALDGGGITVAVVGSGTDVVYPREHARLRERILATGCVVAEWPPGTMPRPGRFPLRNRIISGLSLGVVVVEATRRSGALGTAARAAEQGREVFAVPGPAGAPRSVGPHALLKAGAKLVENVDDVMDELPELSTALPAPAPAASWADRAGPIPHTLVEILAALADGPRASDELALSTGRQISEISTELVDLELRGLIARGPGGRFSRLACEVGPRAGSARGRG